MAFIFYASCGFHPRLCAVATSVAESPRKHFALHFAQNLNLLSDMPLGLQNSSDQLWKSASA